MQSEIAIFEVQLGPLPTQSGSLEKGGKLTWPMHSEQESALWPAFRQFLP